MSLPEHFCCVDVECVATGRRHDERGVAHVVVIDQDERLLLNRKVRPSGKVENYLTPLTGLRPGDLDGAPPLEEVRREVVALLGPSMVLVGQRIVHDIKWLDLVEGRDFAYSIDLAEVFKTYNLRYNNYAFFSLQHEANTLLGPGTITDPHDPESDAKASIQLFKRYYKNEIQLQQAKIKLLHTPVPRSFVKKTNYNYQGVCMARYFPQKCTCGAPCST